MKPVLQTLFGDKVGNCYAACLASLLELSIEEVPNFCADPSDGWVDRLNEWLGARGLFMVDVMIPPGEADIPLYALPDGVPCLLTGPSPRGKFLHVVVGKYRREQGDFIISHDPHPDHTGLSGKPTVVSFLAATEQLLLLRRRPLATANTTVQTEIPVPARRLDPDQPIPGAGGDGRTFAPFDDEQVQALMAWQTCDWGHALEHCSVPMSVHADGLHCSQCDTIQRWVPTVCLKGPPPMPEVLQRLRDQKIDEAPGDAKPELPLV